MHFIVFDIEATCWEGEPPGMVQETIEIGALKLDRYGEVIGTFNRLIRPKLFPTLSLYCRQLTAIDQVELNRAGTFPEVIDAFQEWIGLFDGEEYLLCSWGSFDRTQLIADCRLHDIDVDWLEPHINIRRQYHELKGLRKYKGLKKVVELEGFEFSGNHHRGFADATNLAKVFVKYIDMWRY